MKVREFTVIAPGLHPDADDVANLLFEAGCDDAVVSFQKGVLILEFEREAGSFAFAVISAVSDILKAGASVERLEPDHLVKCLSMEAGNGGKAETRSREDQRGDPPAQARD